MKGYIQGDAKICFVLLIGTRHGHLVMAAQLIDSIIALLKDNHHQLISQSTWSERTTNYIWILTTTYRGGNCANRFIIYQMQKFLSE